VNVWQAFSPSSLDETYQIKRKQSREKVDKKQIFLQELRFWPKKQDWRNKKIKNPESFCNLRCGFDIWIYPGLNTIHRRLTTKSNSTALGRLKAAIPTHSGEAP